MIGKLCHAKMQNPQDCPILTPENSNKVKNMRSLTQFVSAALMLALLSACATQTAQEEEFGGFLSDYSRLTEQEASDGTRILAWINPKMNIADYNAVIIEPVVLSPNSVISEQVDPQRLEEIFDSLEDKLEVAIRDHISITDKRGPGVMRYRIAISGVNAVKRDPRWFEYAPITFAATQVASAAGMRDDVVELFVEAELTDSVTGNVISSAIRKGHSSEGVGQGEPITEDQVDSLLQQWADSADTYLSNLKNR